MKQIIYGGIYSGLKRFFEITDVGYRILRAGYRTLDSLLEKPLEIIPKYTQKRDEVLENCLYKILDGEKLNSYERLKVGFQAPSVKSVFMVFPLLGIKTAQEFIALGPLSIYDSSVVVTASTLLPIAHDSVMGGKLERVVNSLSKEKREEMKMYLDSKKVCEVRDMLYSKGW